MKLLEVYTCINMNCQPPQVLQQTRGRKSIDRFFVKYHAIQSLLHADGNVIHTRVPPLLMLPVFTQVLRISIKQVLDCSNKSI